MTIQCGRACVRSSYRQSDLLDDMIAKHEEKDSNERRRLGALRVLVDELLGRIREVSARDEWSDDERARAEVDLDQTKQGVSFEECRYGLL